MNMKKPVILTEFVAVILVAAFVCLGCVYYKMQTQKQQPNVIPAVLADYMLKEDDASPSFANKKYSNRLNFDISLLNLLQKAEPNKNIIYSPHSVYNSMLLVYFGAADKTEIELNKTLGLDWANNKSDVEHSYQLEKKAQANQILNQIIDFNSASKVYFSQSLTIGESMKKLLNESMEQLNFADDPVHVTEHINRFIEEVTKNNIKNVLRPGSIPSDTQLLIVNAAYFKGQWEFEFDKENTKPENFYDKYGKQISVDMMKKTSNYEYGRIQNGNTRVLKMPYRGENERFSMFIFLPALSSPTAIDDLLAKLTPDDLYKVFNVGYIRQEIALEIPKFSFEHKSDLLPELGRMGARSIFRKEANFSNFSKSSEMQIDQISQLAKIEVNEEGSVAHAVTKIYCVAASAPRPPIEFKCNHPFMFVIHDKISNQILFAGIYRGSKE